MHRSQSSVSHKLLRLEDFLGKSVFDRTSRSLVLTLYGERLLDSAPVDPRTQRCSVAGLPCPAGLPNPAGPRAMAGSSDV